MKSRFGNQRGGFTEILRREVGSCLPRSYAHRIGSSEVIVKQVDLYGKLERHDGCVNTVHFNSTGDFLVSGSDDTDVIGWDWATKSKRFSYPSGHSENIFQAKIMSFSDDRSIVTSAADGQVRLGQVLENGKVETTKLGEHEGRVHSLAMEPGSPHIFYSAGEDGCVQHFDLRSNSSTKLFCCSSSFRDNKQHNGVVRLNAIVIDPRNPNYTAIGGHDGYARLYDIRNCQQQASSYLDNPVTLFCPRHLIGSEDVHITALAYSHSSELLVSYNDELIYLFQKDMSLGPNPWLLSSEDLQKLAEPQLYSGHRNFQTVKGVSFFGHNGDYVVSGSDCGHIFIWKKNGELLRVMVGDTSVVNCIEPHPFLPILATSGIDENIKIWAPMATNSLPLPENVKEIMEANKKAREDRLRVTFSPDVIMRVLRLQRRQPTAYTDLVRMATEFESDDEDDYVFRFSDGDTSSDEELTANIRDCNIS